VVVYSLFTSLQIFTECAGEKKIENRRIFGKDVDKILQLTFFGPPCIIVKNKKSPLSGFTQGVETRKK